MIGQPSGGGLMGQRAGQGQQQQQGFNQGGMMGQQNTAWEQRRDDGSTRTDYDEPAAATNWTTGTTATGF